MTDSKPASGSALSALQVLIDDYKSKCEWDQEMVAAAKSEQERLVEALEKLARLGNGDQYGNSEGNVIAQEALSALSGGGRV